jgi:hypothetical protein
MRIVGGQRKFEIGKPQFNHRWTHKTKVESRNESVPIREIRVKITFSFLGFQRFSLSDISAFIRG